MSTETTTPPSAPDLSRLSREDRIRIAVAVTQGAAWRMPSGGPCNMWVGMLMEGKSLLGVLYPPSSTRPDGGFSATPQLPDYLSDPAAIHTLQVRERIETRFAEEGNGAFARPYGETGPWVHGDDLGKAIAGAVLAKHDVTVD